MRRPQWSPRPRATPASSCPGPGPSLLVSPRSLLSPRYAGALPGRAPTTLPRMTTTWTSERAGLHPRDSIVPRSSARAARRLNPAAVVGPEALGLHREEILFVAHAGRDTAGAKAFGYPTFWVNRTDLPPEELGASPDGVGRDLSDLWVFPSDAWTPMDHGNVGRRSGAVWRALGSPVTSPRT